MLPSLSALLAGPVCVSLVALWLATRARLRLPTRASWNPSAEGLRGWLLVLGFAQALSIAVLIGRLQQDMSVYESPTNTGVTDPSARQAMAAFIVARSVAFVAAGGGFVLYLAKHPTFPLVFVVSRILIEGIGGAEALVTLVGNAAPPLPPTSVVTHLWSSVVWGWYVVNAERVRATYGPAPADATQPKSRRTTAPRHRS